MAAHQLDTVVAQMMTPGVVQIPGDVSVAEAASLMERERTPCLLVKDTESSYGLMTPTDIVRKVIIQGLDPDTIAVRTIMTQPVQFIEYNRLIDEASSLMMASGSPILIVTKEELPVGVLTVRDLIRSPHRWSVRVPATVRVLDGSAPPQDTPVTIIQLNHIGAVIESDLTLLDGTPLTICFSLPDLPTPFTIRGTVVAQQVQTSDFMDGVNPPLSITEIQFSGLSSSDQSVIKAWGLRSAQWSCE
ncbi:MAG: CBS domain-containing protein [Nitrospira sp.]|nr:CBS domain-containing protein [Nitrospira sp.]